ncbi:response regulator [Paenibacillus elgii]|uniref:response regulator n=1 Tax=Paenibacillus elgii TaxID=189691 RepID=UPI00203D43AD|nr:response regulator [Paenibacillus elgii]MCM3269651.1 response regulator [Paenibacillus elgii]
MYKVLLVEDEHYIRAGLRTALDWEAYGLTIAGEAEDGDEGLQAALALKPHIIFSDVRMPGMDGLQMAERILHELPGTKIVLVSGYDDYAYTRQALLLGLCDYLIKPIDEEEIASIAAKLAARLQEDEERKLLEIEQRYTLNRSRKLLFTGLLNEFVLGNGDILQARKFEELAPWFGYAAYQAAVLRVENYTQAKRDHYAGDEESVWFTIDNIGSEMMDKDTLLFRKLDMPSEFIFIRGYEREDEGTHPAQFNRQCEELVKVIGGFRKMVVNVGLGSVVTATAQISQSFHRALLALHQLDLRDGFKVEAYRTDTLRAEPACAKPFVERLKLDLAQLHTARVEDSIRGMFRSLRAERTVPRGELYRLLASLLRMTEQSLAANRPEAGQRLSQYEDMSTLIRLESLDEMESRLLGTMLYHIDMAKKFSITGPKEAIRMLKEYVTANITSEELALGDLAKKYYMSPYQICRLFKSEYKENLQQYMIRLRMEKAKELLKTSQLTVKEIAGLSGYSDVKYFFRMFKKQTGCTPAEFRTNHC